MRLLGRKPEKRLSERLRAFTGLLLEEAERCGLDHLKVTSEVRGGGMEPWSDLHGADASHGFRTILPNEILFDVGDSGDWERCRQTTHNIWRVLNAWKVPYLGAPSGGSGTHTHVFLGHDAEGLRVRPRVEEIERPDGSVDLTSDWPYDVGGVDLRPRIAEMVVRLAFERESLDVQLTTEDPWEYLDIDRVKVAPGVNKSMVRAFGSRNVHRKSLWTMGPGDFDPLPPSRDETYNNHEVIIPSELPVADAGTPGVEHATIARALKKECPQGPACIPGSVMGRGLVCDRCPARM